MNKTLAILMLVAFLTAGCGPQPLPVAPTPIPTLAPATLPATVPTEPATGGLAPTTGAGGGTDDLVQRGAQVFDQNCAVCHNLTSETKVGPGLAGLFSRDTLPNGNPVNEENLKVWIHTGGGGMPAIPLADDQLEAVVAFLKDATQ